MDIKQGQLLVFNNAGWGFIEYKVQKKALKVFNIKENKEGNFTVNKMQLETILRQSNSVKDKISKETLDYIRKTEAMKEEKKRRVSRLKKGQAFKGLDGKVWYYFGKRGEKISIKDENGNEYSAGIDFICIVYDEIKEFKEEADLARTLAEYNELSNKRKIEVALEVFRQEYGEDKSTQYEVLDIGNIVEGIAYYHEEDKEKKLIGLQIKYRYKYSFQSKFTETVGFFPIYIGRVSNHFPIVYSDGYGKEFNEHRYDNGVGDYFTVMRTVIDRRELVKLVDIGKYKR